jgi:hypothetical protein
MLTPAWGSRKKKEPSLARAGEERHRDRDRERHRDRERQSESRAQVWGQREEAKDGEEGEVGEEGCVFICQGRR